MRPAQWHRAVADRFLAEADRLAARRPPWTVRRAALRLDRIDTLRALADSHLRAATVADRTPTADQAATQWADLLGMGDDHGPQTTAPAARGSAGTLARGVAEGSTNPNSPQTLSDGQGLETALREARDEITGLRMELRATQRHTNPQPQETRQ